MTYFLQMRKNYGLHKLSEPRRPPWDRIELDFESRCADWKSSAFSANPWARVLRPELMYLTLGWLITTTQGSGTHTFTPTNVGEPQPLVSFLWKTQSSRL
jgi:hypothetical protein